MIRKKVSIVIKIIALVFYFLLASFLAKAQVVSDFSASADGWTAFNQSTGLYTAATWNSSGGNPTGNISFNISSAQQNLWWTAPAKFIGNQSRAYNQTLSFDMQQSIAGTDNSQNDLQILSPGLTLVYQLPSKPGTTWTSYSVLLKETTGSWHIGNSAGAAPTQQQMEQALLNILSLQIRLKYSNTSASYTAQLDNVVLGLQAFPTPPIISSFSPSSGLPGTTVTITGNNFNTTPAQNVVYFNGVKSTVVSASATQLTVTTPSKIAYGPITVINLANGTQAVTGLNFNPLFDNNKDFGGRVIASTFAKKIDFGSSTTEVGMSVGDLDGDGLTDVLTSGNSLNASVFRNTGQTGSVSTTSFATPLVLSMPSGLVSGTLGPAGRVGQNAIADMDSDGKLDLIVNVGYYQGGNYDNSFAIFLNQSTPGSLSFSTGLAFQYSTAQNNNQGIAVADMDGDGRPELIGAIGNSAPQLGIAENLSTPGNLLFAEFLAFGTSSSTFGNDISFGDLNGDNKPEIIVEAYLGGSINIFENISSVGTILLSPAFQISTTTSINIKVADLDNDGKNDLIFKDGAIPSNIHLKKNNHTTGALSAADFSADILIPTSYSSGGTSYQTVTTADVNGDNKIDIVANDGSKVLVYQNNYSSGVMSASSFVSGIAFEGTTNTSDRYVSCADIDGDNKPEIIIQPQNGTGPNFRVYHNESFPSPQISSITPASGNAGTPLSLTGTSFNTYSSLPQIRTNGIVTTGTGLSNTTVTTALPLGVSNQRAEVTLHGLTGYSKTLTPIFYGNQIINSTSFAAGFDFTLSNNGGLGLTVADFDNDGKPDVVTDDNSTGRIFQNTSGIGAAITTGSLSLLSATLTSSLRLASGDFDGDGKIDIATSNNLFQNNSATQPSFLAAVSTNLYGNNTMLSGHDFNLDGKLDLVSFLGSNQLYLFENLTRNGAFTANGTSFASFTTSTIAPTLITLSGNALSVAANDFDGDGFDDLALGVTSTSSTLTVYRNAALYLPISTSQFAAAVTFTANSTPTQIVSADFDGDGKIDVALGYAAATLSIFKNQSTSGTISFAAKQDITAGAGITAIAAQDLDGDGKPEIVTTNFIAGVGSSFSVYKNTSTSSISFAAGVTFALASGRNPTNLSIADMNLDGKPDIIIRGTGATNFLTVFQNNVSLLPPTITSFTPASGPIGTTVTITGTNFSSIPSGNITKFNGTTAHVISSTSTTIVATVPAGATTGLISVTVSGNTATSATNFTVTPYVPLGNTITCNGSTDYVQVPDDPTLRPLNLTLEAWVNFSSIPTSGFSPIVNKVLGTAINDSYQLFVLNGNLSGTVMNGLGQNTIVQSAFTPTFGQWYHVAFTFDNTSKTQSLYLNGILVGSNTAVAAPDYDNAAVYIGGDFDNQTSHYSFPGSMDEVRIWNFARSQTQIESTLSSSLIGNETGLVAYYKMDETGAGAGITTANSATVTGASLNGLTFGTTCTPYFTLPSISGFSPSSALTGATVTISGINFDPISSNNNVKFNGVSAVVTASTSTSITTTVPVGATAGPISVSIGGCIAVTSSTNFILGQVITVTTQPSSIYSVCDGATLVISTAATGTTNITYQWQIFNSGTSSYVDLANTGGYSNVTTSSFTINSTGNFGAGTYRCKVNGDFATTVYTNTVSFTVNALPTAPVTSNVNNCGPGSVVLTASGGTNGNYLWYDTDGLIAGQNNSTYTTPVISSTSSYSVAITNSTCNSPKVNITATILSLPVAPAASNVSNCGPGSLTLSASGATNGNYIWYDPANAVIAGQSNSTYSTPVISSTSTYSVAITNGMCNSAQVTVTASINTVPSQPITQDLAECPGSTFTLTASGGVNGQYVWYTTSSGGSAISGQVNGTFTTPALTSNTTYYVSINDGTCESARSAVTATVNTSGCSSPVITSAPLTTQLGGTITLDLVQLITTANNNLNVSSIVVIQQPASGAIASVSNGVLTVNYSGITFSGSEQITVQACDLDGNCATQVFTITVDGDIVIYNGISPNGKNPAFIIEYIDLLPETKLNSVNIFDRWENLVWHGTNYDNSSVVFTGSSDGGSDLPSGVYYYKINFSSGRKTETGFLSLRRQ